MIRKKTSTAIAQRPEHLDQALALALGERSEQLLLRGFERAKTGRVTRAAFGGELGEDRSAVLRIVRPPHELLRFEAVDQLRDVRSHAGTLLRQETQRHGLLRSDECREDPELR